MPNDSSLGITRSTPLDALPEFLSVDEVREYLCLSRNSGYTLVASGAIPSVRFGRSIRIPKEALAAYVANAFSTGTNGGRAAQRRGVE